jgi:hypothetical protein
MFGTIRKHQTWLWIIIITLTIISFVIFFSPAQKVNNSQRAEGDFGSISGKKINQDDFYEAKREIYLQYFFGNGGNNWLTSEEEAKKMGFDVEQRTYLRLFLIQKEEELGIHVGSDVAAQFATDMVKPIAQKAGTTPDKVIDELLKRGNMQMADFDRFIRHELGIQELISTVGISGKLITPQEAQALYVRDHQELQVEAVFFNASNYLSQVTVDPAALNQFYTNQLPSYRIPERVQVSYVKFDVSNYLAQAEKQMTNLNEIVDSNLARMGTNTFKDAKTPEEKKAKLREEILRRAALNEANKAAIAFARPLFESETLKAESLDAAAKTNGLMVKVSAPFDRENGPTDLKVEPNFAKAAFSLTPSDPFTQPIVGEDGVYLIAYNKTIPSEIPPLDKIKDQVTTDFKHMRASGLAHMAGLEFSRAVTNGLAQGKSFDALAATAKVKPVTLPPFSLLTRELPEVDNRADLDTLKELAFGTPPGKASEFRPNREGGMVVYVKSQLPIDEARMKIDLPNYVAYVRQSRQREAFDLWFRHEADKALRDTPLFAPRPGGPNAPRNTAKS